jgi:hypothetical protein
VSVGEGVGRQWVGCGCGRAGIGRYGQAGESRQRHGSGVICIGAVWVKSRNSQNRAAHGREHEAQRMLGVNNITTIGHMTLSLARPWFESRNELLPPLTSRERGFACHPITRPLHPPPGFIAIVRRQADAAWRLCLLSFSHHTASSTSPTSSAHHDHTPDRAGPRYALPWGPAIHCPPRRSTLGHVSLRPSARLSPPCPHSVHCRRKSCASVRVSVTASELSLGDHRDRRHPCPSLTLW